MSEKGFIHILDSTLRDGSHALSHQFTAEQATVKHKVSVNA